MQTNWLTLSGETPNASCTFPAKFSTVIPLAAAFSMYVCMYACMYECFLIYMYECILKSHIERVRAAQRVAPMNDCCLRFQWKSFPVALLLLRPSPRWAGRFWRRLGRQAGVYMYVCMYVDFDVCKYEKGETGRERTLHAYIHTYT